MEPGGWVGNPSMTMPMFSLLTVWQFGAPMVSATHYMDRDHDYLAEISPRRYFCTQCHVVQTDAREPVDNTFVDVYEIVMREQANSKQQGKSPQKTDEITP